MPNIDGGDSRRLGSLHFTPVNTTDRGVASGTSVHYDAAGMKVTRQQSIAYATEAIVAIITPTLFCTQFIRNGAPR